MPLWFRVVRIWLPIAVAVTAAAGLTYVAVQQSYRNGLDDPQLQLATDGAARLDAGVSPESLATSPTVDADKSLAPFVIVFGSDDAVLASGATLAGTTPKPPTGVLATARSKGTDRVTWQPRPGVRIASVSAAASDGRVVLAGRNMRAVESRIDDLTKITAFAWGSALVGVLIASLLAELAGLRLKRA
ncbi:MAG TPA: hypothetical protein VIL41_02395 [Coriobacteriia bacterium]